MRGGAEAAVKDAVKRKAVGFRDELAEANVMIASLRKKAGVVRKAHAGEVLRLELENTLGDKALLRAEESLAMANAGLEGYDIAVETEVARAKSAESIVVELQVRDPPPHPPIRPCPPHATPAVLQE